MQKVIYLFCFFVLYMTPAFAQDAVIISEGNFERGVIKGTDYTIVVLQKDNQSIVQFDAKSIHSFVWNGETYVSKPMADKKKVTHRFFKLIESGEINLYTLGDKRTAAAPQPARVKVRPTFGVGIGSGGLGGGLGGGITLGNGGNRHGQTDVGLTNTTGKVFYFIEKPGSGPMLEINLANINATKNMLLQKLNGDDDLIERVKGSDEITDVNLIAFIKAYNSGRK